MLRSINQAAGSPISMDDVNRNLRITWGHLQEEVRNLEPSEPHDSVNDDGEDSDDDDLAYVVLEAVEEQILDLVAHVDPHEPTVTDILRHIPQNRTRVKHYLDRLVDYGFLGHYEDFVEQDGDTYSVTKAGRKYLVDNDLA